MIRPFQKKQIKPLCLAFISFIFALLSLQLLINSQPAAPVSAQDKVARSVSVTSADRSETGPTDIYSSVTFLPIIQQNCCISMTFLPIVARNYNTIPAPFAVQFYGSLSNNSGFNQLAASGARWVRFTIEWNNVEPTNTVTQNFQWAGYDASLTKAAETGVNLVVTIDHNPTWAAIRTGGMVTDINDLKQFVSAVVSRYPQVTYWELYNEPDNNLTGFGGQGARYATMINAVYPVIKAANPAAKVAMGGISLDNFYNGIFDKNFLSNFLSHCAQPCFDVANFHYYPVYRYLWEKYGPDIIGKTNYVKQQITAYGFNRPIMNTETGWPYLNIDADWGGPDIQGRYMTKVYVRTAASGLLLANWYSMLDADPSQPGLLGNSYPNFELRPAYYALQRAILNLKSPISYARALSSIDLGNPNLEGYVFSVPKDSSSQRLDVVWYDCPSLDQGGALPLDCTTTAKYAVPAARIGVMDHLSGTLEILNDGSDGKLDGKVSLTINTNPVYIFYNP